MKYVPTVNLWEDGMQDKIRSGEVKLQCGQHVVCGVGNAPARFVGLSESGIFYVQHYQGSPKANRERFDALRGALKVRSKKK